MILLNLVYPEQSEIKYEIISYPDGQQDIRIKKEGIMMEFGDKMAPQPTKILSRLHTFKHLEVIACACSALRNMGVTNITLVAPYILGERSDRTFTDEDDTDMSSAYFRDVIAPFLRSLNFHRIAVLDPHSDVTEACLPNLKKTTNYDLVNWALNDIAEKLLPEFQNAKSDKQLPDLKSFAELMSLKDEMVLIGPDAGAEKKILHLAKKLNHENVEFASKLRNPITGKITKVRFGGDVKGKICVIVDDICDGGRTFTELAKLLRQNGAIKVYLIVTHSIFSAGFEDLYAGLDGIYTTNSVIDVPEVTHLYSSKEEVRIKDNFVKQINLF